MYRRAPGPVNKTRVNHEIRLSPVRLINERNEQVGVVDTRDALQMAEEAGLDLVEVQADVRPPLCKIMDYGKWKYEQSKKKQSSKAQELKEVRLGRSAKIDDHDVEIRVSQARRFLMEGHKVLFIQRFRGREMAHLEIGMDRLNEIVEELGDISKVESPPRVSGRQATMVLVPDRAKITSLKAKLEQEAQAAKGPAPSDAASPAQAPPPAEEQPASEEHPEPAPAKASD